MTARARRDWHNRAACRGADLRLFFAPDGERAPERERREKKAKAICRECPVRTECLEQAIGADDRGLIVARGEINGVWGGMNEDERASERRKRMRRVQPANQAKAG